MPAINGRAMKARGSAFERDVAQFLREHGHRFVERAYGAGRSDDRGDLDGLPGWVLECKAHKTLDLAGWMAEAERERTCGRQPFAAVIAKRRGKPTSDAYVVLDLATFARLLTEMDSQIPDPMEAT